MRVHKQMHLLSLLPLAFKTLSHGRRDILQARAPASLANLLLAKDLIVRDSLVHARHAPKQVPAPPALLVHRVRNLLHLAHPPVRLGRHVGHAPLRRGQVVGKNVRELVLQLAGDAEALRGSEGLRDERGEALGDGGEAHLEPARGADVGRDRAEVEDRGEPVAFWA